MKKGRREFLKTVAVGSVAGTMAPALKFSRRIREGTVGRRPVLATGDFPCPARLPNIILIMADQHRADVSSRDGFPLDTTPFLDSLAAGGTWFNKAYTAAPACVPARTSLLTGRFPNTTQVRSNHNAFDGVFEADILDVVRAKGYKTAHIGKNHSYLIPEDFDFRRDFGHASAFDADQSAEKKAFDEYMQSLNFHCGFKSTPFPLELQYPYRIVSEAQKWIGSLRGRPFFMWMSFAEPHNPYQVPGEYWNMFPPDNLPPVRAGKEALVLKGYKYRKLREIIEMSVGGLPAGDVDGQMPRMRSNYFGLLRLLDDQIKRLTLFLWTNSLMENTVLVYVSDHGDYVGEYGLAHKGAGMPEVLMRIPMIWAGAGIRAGAGPHPAHVSIVDILPTICEAISINIPDGVQGRSLWPILTGQEYPPGEFAAAYAEQGFGGLHIDDTYPLDPRDEGAAGKGGFDELNTWTQSGSMRMLRKDDWKMEYDMMGRGALYNLRGDPSELTNLWDDPGSFAVKIQLMGELLKRTIRYQDDIPHPRLRYRFKRDKRNYYD